MAAVPKLWPGSTIICLGTGPSLTQADVNLCRGRARVIAVKDAIRLAPWADVLYSGEIKWWRKYGTKLQFEGLKYGIEDCDKNQAAAWAPLLKQTGMTGLERDPGGLRTGKNSGYQAINLAMHFGAARIVLLGYDLQVRHGQTHFFGDHPWSAQPMFADFRPLYDTLVKPLAQLGIEIVNASAETALTCFPRASLADVLPEAVAA